mgnify:CR=1 FL=1
MHPEDMPWELSRHGLLKHLMNEGMNTRMETVDAYMLIIPPGSKSGKHRQLAEECLYVLEGRGYDLHQDCDEGGPPGNRPDGPFRHSVSARSAPGTRRSRTGR